jgi:hypothetical protein
MGDLDWGMNFNFAGTGAQEGASQQNKPTEFDWNGSASGPGHEGSNGFEVSATPAKGFGGMEAMQGAAGIFDSPFAGID